jgi:histidinol-phosphatase (PHP family)
MWSNYHTHSNYCDGKGELTEYVEQAKSSNVVSLGFSSHAPLNFPCNWCMKANDLNDYLQTLEELKNSHFDIEIYKSLEVDYVPDSISIHEFKDRLDYTIGSIHYVDTFPDGTHWEIDGAHAHFLDGLDKIFHGDYRAAFSRYFELTREMIQTACPTIIGHVDKAKIQNAGDKFFNEHDSWYQAEVKNTIALIKKYNAIVEVNTRGLYQKKSTTTYPSPWVLELLHQQNIPVTLSSDAHHPKDLTNQFSEAATQLMEIGFKSIMMLHEGNWKPLSFNTHGIIL